MNVETVPLDAPPDALPPMVRRLLDLVGREAVARLLEEGGRIYVPPQPAAEHRLTRLVGLSAASKLAEEYGAEWLELPQCTGAERARRNEYIRAQVAAGSPRGPLAKKFGLSLRQLRRIVGC